MISFVYTFFTSLFCQIDYLYKKKSVTENQATMSLFDLKYKELRKVLRELAKPGRKYRNSNEFRQHFRDLKKIKMPLL